jgi:hypothetical protein
VKYFQKISLILIILSLIGLTSCFPNSNKNSDVPSLEYKSAHLTNPQKKYLNFLTELPLGRGTKYNYSNFNVTDTKQESFDLKEGDENTCAFAFDRKRYAYIACNISPVKIIKYDMVKMKRIDDITLPANENRDECRVAALIAISPDTIIHASYTNPCVFTKIDGTTMKVTGTLKGDDNLCNDKFIRGMTYDGKYVYAGSDSTPGRIIKFDPVTMKKIDEATFENSNIDGVFAITICGNYLVGVCGRSDDEEAKIFRLDLNDLHKEPDTITVPGYASYQSICTDGQFIYAATYTNPIRVVKVDALSSKLKFVSGFTGKKDEEAGNFSILFNGSDVIVSTWQLDSSIKDKLIKLSTKDMTRKDTLITPCKFPADLMYLNQYIYTCCDKPTGVVLRLKF